MNYKKYTIKSHKSSRYITITLCSDCNVVSSMKIKYKGVDLMNTLNVDCSRFAKITRDRVGDIGLNSVKFDRGSTKYHGHIRNIAESLRCNGFIF